MYDGIKKALGPTQTKTAPLKSTTGETITDKKKQLERWVEHYSELYSRETKVSDSALDAIDNLPIMEDLDDEPTVEELSKAIDKLSAGKTPGSDGIPPDLIKECKSSLLTPLQSVLCLCWKEGTIPQDLRDAKIMLPRRGQCNYRVSGWTSRDPASPHHLLPRGGRCDDRVVYAGERTLHHSN